MAILYILCGPSGCGKSTWAVNKIQEESMKTLWVSRDALRFSMLKPGEDYFAHEKEVYKKFVTAIVSGLGVNMNIIADATHLNEFSRRKLTQAIDAQFNVYQIVYVVFNTSFEECLRRNASRKGYANVPETIIRNMFRTFQAPTLDEDERAIQIIEVGE